MPVSPPITRLSAFPENERRHAIAFNGLLHALHHYAVCFQYALQLFEYSEAKLSELLSPRPKMEDQEARFMFAGWMHIAARDATMSLYHFAKTIEEIRECFRHLPTFRPIVKHDVIRLSVKLFSARFPNYLKMRHSIAHSAKSASLEERMRNAVGGISLRENLMGRKFTSTVEGRLLSTEISRTTLARLVDLETRFYSAFEEAHEFFIEPRLSLGSALDPKTN